VSAPSVQRHAGASEQGRERAHNEDRWSADDDLGLYVVSDGMGGGPAGELASEIVVRALPALFAERFDPGVRAIRARDASAGMQAALAQLSGATAAGRGRGWRAWGQPPSSRWSATAPR